VKEGALVEVACTCAAHPTLRLTTGVAAVCPQCGREAAPRSAVVTAEGGLTGCVACGHAELYTRKDFPRALGVGIVVVAAVLAPFTYYASLGVAALLDLSIYLLGPNVVCCYVCGATHRGFAPNPRHPRFDITIQERLRYGDRAVMGSPMRPGGTANAPDPEH